MTFLSSFLSYMDLLWLIPPLTIFLEGVSTMSQSTFLKGRGVGKMDLDKNTLGDALYIPIVIFRFGKSSSLIRLRASHVNGDGISMMEVVPEINFGLIERSKVTKSRKRTVKDDERKSKWDSDLFDRPLSIEGLAIFQTIHLTDPEN